MSLFWPSNLSISIAVLAGVLTPALSPLYAAELTQHYAISTGSLSAALLAVSQQSKQLIVFNPTDVESYRSKALEGDFTVEQVLNRLLGVHGLTYSRDSRGAIIVRFSETQTSNEGTSSLPALVVYGELQGEGGFAASATPTTRTNVPLRLTPQSITVINTEIMEAQGAKTVTDALKNISGVTVLPGALGSAGVNVRGYQSAVLLEGMRSSSASTPLDVPAIALQSVEAIKGPSAILSGAGSPGGTINLVYKKPQLETAREVRLGYGSYNERQLSADTTGAVLDSDYLSYRVIVEGKESSTNAAGYDGLRELYFSPSLRWQNEGTDLNLRYTRIQRTTPFQPYTVAHAGKPWTGHLPQPLGNEEDSLKLRQNEFSLSLEQALSDNWQYVGKVSYTEAEVEQYGWYTGSELEDDNTVWLGSFSQGAETHNFNLDSYVRGLYEWGELKSTTVLGVSASRSRGVNKTPANFNDWLQVNIYEPLPDLPSAKSSYLNFFSESIPVGAYWQQHLSYGKWNLNAGLRFDSTWNGVFRRDDATESQNKQVWSPSIGLAYEAAPWLTVYASHLQGYQPPLYRDREGNLLPEQVSKQNEAGLKFTLLGEKLLLTTAAYKTEFSNYTYFDIMEGGYVSTAGYVSRGFEIEAQGALTPNWDVVGYYNYGRTEFAEDMNTHDGLPRHKASVWTRYQLRDGVLKGLSAGVGLYYSGVAYLDREKEYQIPSQLQTDLNLGYTRGDYSLDLAARNIFNRDLYVTSLDGYTSFIPLQQPRTVELTASYRF